MEKSHRAGKKIARFFTHWSVKKVIVTLLIIAVLVTGGLWLRGRIMRLALPAAAGVDMRTRTSILTKTTLKNTVTVTGTVKSGSVTNVTTTGISPVAEILVKEGDRVNTGDVLCRLDTEDLAKEMTKKKTALAEGITTAQKNYDKAVADRDTAYTAAIDNEAGVETARLAYDAARQKFDAAKVSVIAPQAAYDAALVDEQLKGAALNDANVRLAADPENAELLATRDNAQAAYDGSAGATVLRKGTEDALNTAKAQCDYAALEKTLTATQTAYESLRQMLDSLQAGYKGALTAVDAAAEQLKTAKKSDALETLQEQIDDCTITAPTSGTVTSVGATVGSAVAIATPLFVLQDTDHLEVAVNIDEYDVNNVKTGCAAVIQSDATGETEIPGTLTQLSLTATQTIDSTASGFGAEVTVSDADASGLLIGMSVKVKLVLAEKPNVFAVPFDAVGMGENGQSVVYAKSGSDFTPVPVTTGMETDTLVEIAGDGLTEGMEIRSYADESALTVETMPEGIISMGGAQQGNVTMMAPAVGGGRG